MSKIFELIQNYGPYLEDLKKRLYRSMIFFVIIFITGIFLSPRIIRFFLYVFRYNDVTVITNSPFQFFDLSISLSLDLALLITIPLVVANLYLFIRPAISKKEFRFLLSWLPISFFLFIFGFFYGFFTMHWAFYSLAQLNMDVGLVNLWDISLFLSGLILTSTLLGILFEFPIAISILMRFGILKRAFLIKHRKVAYAIMLIIVSLLPPTDGLSNIIMILPLIILYESSILFGKSGNFTKKIVTIQ
jgi:sec-independent protein translocase protein TatC